MEIDSKTSLFAVLGNPVKHSKSPLIHNIALKEANLNAVYLAFEVKKVKTAIEAMKEFGIIGYSVTIPHKIEAMKYLDEIETKAKKIGAINTVHNKDGKLYGYNTDCLGAMKALKEKTNLIGKKVYLIGAGGAARAIIAGLEEEKANITVFDIEEKKAIQLAKEFNAKTESISKIDSNADIIINATPIGMYPKTNETSYPKELLRKEMLVFDVVYNPLETKLIREAKQKGCKTIQGIEMFLGQAFEQFRIWQGTEPPKEKMREALIKELKKEQEEKK
ncbi:MAG: shikimate dehydrogenase [archaeon]